MQKPQPGLRLCQGLRQLPSHVLRLPHASDAAASGDTEDSAGSAAASSSTALYGSGTVWRSRTATSSGWVPSGTAAASAAAALEFCRAMASGPVPGAAFRGELACTLPLADLTGGLGMKSNSSLVTVIGLSRGAQCLQIERVYYSHLATTII